MNISAAKYSQDVLFICTPATRHSFYPQPMQTWKINDRTILYNNFIQGPLPPARCLADRMRGRLEYVNKKMKIIRSRSAERLRGCVRPDLILTAGPGERQPRPVRREARPSRARPAEAEFSGPVVGQARALVSCLPSPYDNDVLAFQVSQHSELGIRPVFI